MPDIMSYRAATRANILGVGDSGTGKTGSLLSLIKAGYNIRMIDTDRGADILLGLIRANGIKVREGQVQVELVEDKMVKSALGGVVGDGSGFHKAVKLIEKWPDGTKPEDWSTDTVLVIDSWSTLGQLSMTNSLRLAGRTGQKPEIQHWGSAIDDLRGVLNIVLSDYLKCHTIIFTHITYIGVTENSKGDNVVTKSMADQGLFQQYPNALGSKLPAEMGRYFNNMIGYTLEGSGALAKRKISTVPMGNLGIKTASPEATERRTYPIETGLASFFKDLGIQPPGAKA